MDSSKGMPFSQNEVLFSIGLGLLLAWWNTGHENGILFMESPFDRALNCMSAVAGSLIAWIILAKRTKTILDLSTRRIVFVTLAMAVIGVALDAEASSTFPYATIALQSVASILFFTLFTASFSLIGHLSTKKLVAIASIALGSYCLSEVIVFLAYSLSRQVMLRCLLRTALLGGIYLLAKSSNLCNSQSGVKASPSPSIPIRPKAQPPLPRELWLHVETYSIVFGLTHVLASGITPESGEKVIVCYTGIGLAVLVFVGFRCAMGNRSPFWPFVRKVVFPAALLSFTLLPFANTEASVISVSLAECSMDVYYAFILICAVIASRKINVPASFGALTVLGMGSIGFLAGCVIGNLLIANEILTPTVYNALTAGALVLLSLGTFWIGDDKRISSIWGLEEHLTPKRFADKHLERNCAIAARNFGLTKRETEILLALAQKQTARDIANRDFVSIGTVRSQIASIHKKMHAHNQQEVLEVLSKVEESESIRGMQP